MLLPTISNRQERTDYDRKNKEFPLPLRKRRPVSRSWSTQNFDCGKVHNTLTRQS